ncbi:unnamed protein product [Brassica napus]|uniref:(rape) hypothetical protein n=2 Tax=Brassica napus TaxID=3708 RepID=A0A816JIW7_BRANA|nr:unnamed protein product [Brassica napus]
MENLWRIATGQDPNREDYEGVEFWSNPERSGWLTKQGDYIKTWRRRWFVLKRGKLLWFKDQAAAETRGSTPRGVISVGDCLTVKGAEDVVNKPFAFEISSGNYTLFFVADNDKEKEEWINSIGRSIVQHSRSVTDSEVLDYDHRRGKNKSYLLLEMRNTELIFIPTPTVGHLVPFLELARRLINQDDRIRITVLVMKLQGQSHLDTYVNSIASSLPFVRFIDVPELEDKPTLGSTQSAEAFVYDFTERNIPLVRNIVIGMLSSPSLDGVKMKGIVADFFCLSMVDVARDVTLPFYVFLTTSSGFLAMLQYLADRHSNDTSVFVRDSGEMLSIPGFVNPVPVNVLPTALFMEDGYDAYVKLAMLFNKTNGILVNSSIDIEPYSVNHFSSEKSYPPVYAVGPIFNPKAQPHPDQDHGGRDELMKWLDDQPEDSVVFLCFGSMGRLKGPVVKEIAHGLELCQYRFIWSLRAEDDSLPEGFLDRVKGRGMVCGWSPQVEILDHKAVGGFVSHCGWNSIVESLWFGVPIVTWPMYAEQQLNAFLMVKELNLAVELKLDYRARRDELVSANEIDAAIRCVMNKYDGLVRKRVMDISQMVRRATLNGGSSYLTTEKFIQDVIGVKP